MSRSASSSYKGYTYQRARLLHLIFCEYYTSNDEQLNNNITFCEENLEDIDISITDNNGDTEIHLYQEKYLSGDENESFVENSGLTKVIISHYNNNEEITKINYEVVSLSGTIYCSKKLNNFLKLIKDDTNNYLIGKFIVLNFCNSKLFSRQENNEEFLTVIKNNLNIENNIIDEKIKITERDKIEKTNRYKLNQFCYYCNDENNITDLIIYLKKINFKIIINKTFNEIHNETLFKLRNILPKFFQMCDNMDNMSNEYKNFYSEILYGLFEMIIVKNLFQTNDKMTIKQLIDTIKNKINNSITNDDKLTIVIYTIKHFIREKKYDEIKCKFFENNYLINFMLNKKITITKFICNFNDQEQNVNIDNNIRDIIRKIIYEICLLKKYDFFDDVKLLGFLHRTHTKIKFTGLKYNSLKEIDNLILNT